MFEARLVYIVTFRFSLASQKDCLKNKIFVKTHSSKETQEPLGNSGKAEKMEDSAVTD